MGAITSVAPKLAKLLPRLASTFDAEIIATVGAIRKTLEAEGLDLHDLAAHVGAALYKPSGHQPKADPFDAEFWRRADEETKRRAEFKKWQDANNRKADEDAPRWEEAIREAAKNRADRQRSTSHKAYWPKAPGGLRWADMAMCAIDVLGGSLTEKETDFLIQMHHETQSRHPTEKQAAWLTGLHKRALASFR